jgi:hypothetical protein
MNLTDRCRSFVSAHAAHLFLSEHNYYYNREEKKYLYFGKDRPLEIVIYLKHLYRIKAAYGSTENV